ncbi:MAG: DUF4159 domain-containing protein [Caldilineaceae bacterium]
MSAQHLLRSYPGRRVSAFDGMAVTADVWQEAHNYHLYHERLHALAGHGVGIVSGLEVIAGDPPSQVVYIMPGVAIDPSGNMLVVSEPTPYDLSSFQAGTLHMLISYDESRPQPINGRNADSPYYVYTGYNIETVIDTPDSPLVELARIHRPDIDAPITNAADNRPGHNQIDLRFRPRVVTLNAQRVMLGVHTLNRMAAPHHARGHANVAAQLGQSPWNDAWIDDAVVLNGDLSRYTVLSLVAKANFQLEVEALNVLYRYLQGGGVLFLESCRREGGATPGSDNLLRDIADSLGVRLEAVKMGHPLLSTPHLFPAPPVGYETQGAPSLWAGDGIVFSTFDYGCLWTGERRDRTATREEIRAGFEFAQNLVHFAQRRRAAVTR